MADVCDRRGGKDCNRAKDLGMFDLCGYLETVMRADESTVSKIFSLYSTSERESSINYDE